MRWAMYVTLSPVWFDPGESVIGVLTPFWILYAMHDALVKPMPGNHQTPSLAESWTVSAGPEDVRVQAARGVEVPQRRPLHVGRREVQLPAHQGRGRQDPPGKGPGDRHRRSVPGAFPPARALSRLHDLLRHAGHGGRMDRAEEVLRVGRIGRLQEGTGGARAIQVREQYPRRRARPGSLRGVLAEGPVREAPGLQERARGDHPHGHAEAGRGRPRVPAGRPAGPGREARSQFQARLLGRDRHLLPRLPRSVGSQVAVA